MIVFLLLVIIAILLLGASRFLGMVAAILGMLIAVVAVGVGLGVISSAFHVDAADLLMYLLFGILPLIVAWAFVSSHKPKPTGRHASPTKFASSAPLSNEEKSAVRRRLRGLE